MDISKATLGVVAAASLVAGAGGAWLATRSHEATAPAAQTAAGSGDLTAATGVEQSEAVVTDPAAGAATSAPAASIAPAPAPAPAPARTAPERQAPARTQRPSAPAREQSPSSTPAPERTLTPPALETARPIEPEPVRPAAPPEPKFVDLVIPSEAVVGLQVDTPVSTETARVEDQIVAHVTRDVKVGDRVAIPSGAKAQGEVTLVERGGKLKDRARLGVRFTSIVLADGTRVPIETDTIYREGEGQGTQSAAKIGGGAIGGAIIGGIIGGAKGAAIGGSVGAGAGTAAVVAGGRNAATLSSGSPVTVRLQQPATVTVEK
jgi:hypothetical protein